MISHVIMAPGVPFLAALILAFCSSVTSSAQPPPLDPSSAERISRIQANYSASISRLNRACDWQFCRDPELRRTWALLGEWLSAYLDDHPAASAADLAASAKELAAKVPEKPRGDGDWKIDLDAEAMALGQGAFLVAASYWETGTFFVVGRGQDGRARVTWSIDRYASLKAADKELRCWRVAADCGPLYGTIALLPPMATGEPRFYVDANFAGNGTTVSAQTSIWAWNGQEARLLAVGEYETMIDDDRHIGFDGHDLTIPTKEELGPFSTNGSSTDPAATWTFHITPDGVEDRGVRWRDAELFWVSQFLDALLKGEPTSHWAAPAVARKLRHVRSDLSGLLMDWKVTPHGRERQLLIEADRVKLTFTLVEKDDQLYATAVDAE